MRVIGWAIKPTELEHTRIARDLRMRANGWMTNNTGKAMKPGQKAPATRVNTFEAKKRALVSTPGPTVPYTKVNGKTIKSTASEPISGLTAGNTTDSGVATICKATVFICTPMV